MLIWLLLGGGAFVLLVIAVFAIVLTLGDSEGGDLAFGDRVQVVDIQGELLDSRSVVEQLQRFESSDSVHAILLNIDSPGGGVAVSQEIYSQIKRLRERNHKIVVAYLSSVGASGAYYAACGADKIIANPGSVVGSIGVIAEWVNYGDLLEWAKMKEVVLKTGEFKDAGSATRSLTDREKAYFQSLIDDMHGQFIHVVADGRKMELQQVKTMADGRVFSGRDALERKLIDATGDFQDAVDMTAKLAGIEGKPTLIRDNRQRTTLLDVLTGDISHLMPFNGKSLKSQIRFQYLWK
jgi:protease IV